MQYNRKANKSLEVLPNKHIDTGMGFERLCMVLQGVQSNYDTDVFTPIIREIEAITNKNYGKDEKVDVAIRVISDHVRAVAFSIADGQLPSNNGAGYVIRRILRRAVRYGFTFLDKKEPFIYRLVDTLTKKMGKAFPELKAQKQLIENVIKEEESSFLRTLDQGLVLLDKMVKGSKSKEISGSKVFELKDTYGFPEDLTDLILREKGYTYNSDEFKNALKEQQDRGREASELKSDDWTILHHDEVECNHTATHLLHQALREVLGDHVEQKGSAVHSKHLRFDFSHFSKLTVEELRDVENFVNARIEGKIPLEENRSLPKEQAIADGAMSLFGEKYGDDVRTIRFGQSIELCGGTHVKNTADIWHFKITAESAVASGIRRIEAITMDAVKDFYFENNRAYFEMKDLLNNAKEPIKALQNLQDENSDLKKQIENLLKEKTKNIKSELKNELTEINGVQFLAKKLDLDASGIKDVCFELGSQFDNLFLLFGAEHNGKAILSCYVSKELVASKDLNAGTIVRELGKHIQGGGGGQPFFATAGGKNPAGIEAALEASKGYL
ncbi:UNVERIFIED_CONTAM: hypothetical protein GTU68_024231 [Idotea baltica]|nr:hypothetical protein [Idotea baltica]